MKKIHLFFWVMFALKANAYTHLEPRQQNPISLTPDGKKILALHSTAHSLSVFDVSMASRHTPILIQEIPLSTAPVTVKARTQDEVWVVNEGSDSVSVISLSQSMIIDTLRVGDEPADVVFANGKAFISCAQKRVIYVFDASTRQAIGQIPVPGVSPRALIANRDGSKLYVACLYSGNRTTILAQDKAPLQPPPTNLLLPDPPRVGLIVRANDSRVRWSVMDHDIAEIDTSAQVITRWVSDVGTNLFALEIHPDGALWCANSDSNNLTRFEPELNGDFVKHRLSRIALPNTNITHYDLNPGITRATSPVSESIAQALAAPTAINLSADGQSAWVAAFNSDRIAEIDINNGAILRRVDLRPTGKGVDAMRGPRGMAMGADRIYVLNKISDTLATVRISDGAILSDIPLGSTNPMPANIRAGRGVIYDARLSGNGTISCATCHIDADRDGLAWDLGDPGGNMVSIPAATLSIHDTTVYNEQLHPMKGPLTTQTLRGLASNDADPIDPTDGISRPPEVIVTKFHWRGDKPSLQSFKSTFPKLMGGRAPAATTMDRMAEYLLSISHAPNPNLNLDRSLNSQMQEGNAVKGKAIFENHSQSHCVVCHSLPGGTDQNIDLAELVNKFQPIKNPSLRTVYQRVGIFNSTTGATSLSGFGLNSDGSGHQLPTVHPYSLSIINRAPLTATKQNALADLTAFILSFDTGTAPAACHDFTLTLSNRFDPNLLNQISILESRATAGESGLIIHGVLAGEKRRFRWDPISSAYLTENELTALSRNSLFNQLIEGDAITFIGVMQGEESWRSTDRNLSGEPDILEPAPDIHFDQESDHWFVRWPKSDWFLVTSPDLVAPWLPLASDPISDGNDWKLPLSPETEPQRFFRLQRTW